MTATPRESTSFVEALSIQGNVMHALMLRELHSRFGRENFGFLWLIIEPLMLASVISLIHHVTGGRHQEGGIDPGTLGLIGYTTFIVFRGIVNRAEGMFESNAQLLYHRNVTLLDIAMTRAVMESLGCMCAMVTLLGIYIAIGFADLPVRPLYLFAAFGLMTWLSFGLSLVVASATYDRRTAGRLVHPMTYFAMPVSGAFFTMEFLPIQLRSYLAWNPMVTIFEMARYGQFAPSSSEYIYTSYLVAWCVALTYIGLVMIRSVREKIHLA